MVDQSSPVTDVQQAVPVAQVTPGDVMVFADEAFRNIAIDELLLTDIEDIQAAMQATFDRIVKRHSLSPLPCKSGEGADAVAMASRLQQARHSAVEPVERDNVLREAAILLRRFVALSPDATQTREAELVAALKPFAEACNFTTADDSESLYDTLAAEKLTWRDLRRARAALNGRDAA